MAKTPAARMYRDFRELLSALNARRVKYLLIGGYAVGYHAQPRATKDLDLLVKADARNAEALLGALLDFGAPLEGVNSSDLIADGTFLRFGRSPVAVDILSKIDGISFDEAWPNRILKVIDVETGLKAPLISKDDLITAKADIAAIEKASARRKRRPRSRRAAKARKSKGPNQSRSDAGRRVRAADEDCGPGAGEAEVGPAPDQGSTRRPAQAATARRSSALSTSVSVGP